jgi:hypothetical protein
MVPSCTRVRHRLARTRPAGVVLTRRQEREIVRLVLVLFIDCSGWLGIFERG